MSNKLSTDEVQVILPPFNPNPEHDFQEKESLLYKTWLYQDGQQQEVEVPVTVARLGGKRVLIRHADGNEHWCEPRKLRRDPALLQATQLNIGLGRLLRGEAWIWEPISDGVWLSYAYWLRRSNAGYIKTLDQADVSARAKEILPRLKKEQRLLESIIKPGASTEEEYIYFVYWYWHAALFEHYRGAGCWSGEHRVQLERLLAWRKKMHEALILRV